MVTHRRSAGHRIGPEQRQHGQPPGEVAATVIRRTVASTSSASVELRSATATGLPAFHTAR